MIFDDLFTRNLLLVTGKGGIGKTLITASLGMAAAAKGLKVCLIESSDDDQISPLFGFDPIGHKMTLLRDNLWAINLNPPDNFRDFVIKHLGAAALFEKVFTKSIVQSFIRAIPGIAELTLLGRLFHSCELDERGFDLVIHDGYASGHFLALLKTPDAILKSGLIGPVVKETQRVQDYLRDASKTGLVQVTTAEDLVVSETIEFARTFTTTGIDQACVIVNRMLSPIEDQLTDLEPGPFRDFCIWSKQRASSEGKNWIYLKDQITQNAQGKAPLLVALPEQGAFSEPLDSKQMTSWLEAAR